ncbi:MAG: hypothetical protein OEY10_06405 [Nitrosopumilus sp.]|nr:hypothetical protein [Nitrosopumilus sp.]
MSESPDDKKTEITIDEELANKIRSDPEYGGTLTVVAVALNDLIEQRASEQKTDKTGIIDELSKGFKLANIFKQSD